MPFRSLYALTILSAIICSSAHAGQKLLVGSYYQSNVYAYDAETGEALGIFIPSGRGGMRQPDEIIVGPNGDIYISPYSYQSPPWGNKIYTSTRTATSSPP